MAIIGLDVGTSRCKGVLFAEDGTELGFAARDIVRVTGPEGSCELNADQVAAAVRGVVAELCRTEPARAIAAGVFGGGAALIRADGRALTPLLSTTDPRSQPQVARLEQSLGRRLREITGLTPHASFALGKWCWLVEAYRDLCARATAVTAVTAAELVSVALGVPPFCDRATASTTMAADLLTGDWSAEVLAHAGLQERLLPAISACGEPAGRMPRVLSSELGVAPDCLIVSGGHDQQVCALGAGVLGEGVAAHSLGTVECVTAAFAGKDPLRALLAGSHPILFHVWEGYRAVLGYHYCGTDLFTWAERNLTLEGGQEAVGRAVSYWSDRGTSVLALPYFAGSATPSMNPSARGVLAGLTLETGPEEILAGIVQGQTFEIRRNLELWRDAGIEVEELISFGGGARWDSLLQWKADLLRLPIRRAARREPGCFGAFLLAMRALHGPAVVEQILEAQSRRETCVFEPRQDPAQAGDAAYVQYRRLSEWTTQCLYAREASGGLRADG